ncbi:hypothetical protein FSARC_671 [Fusarium sarcochroum]|uniref:Aminotransferase class I/classII domain-containing protein n=1 Tax=Fusarium sarcochroum TaxID=1208366 RepID=A0A8H4XFT9_9HYPO|nr:hypothetical protein FSARC_671 [Fusarium sarcochroum]
MLAQFEPSERARAALQQGPAWALMQKVKTMPKYHPERAPHGLINLSGALNSLMGDWMASYTERETFSMSECLSYGPLTGSEDLLNAADGFFNSFFDPSEPVLARNILAANGVTSLMDMMAWTLCDPGDGVLYPTPNFYMLDYNMTVRAGLRTVPVSTTGLIDPFEHSGLSGFTEALDIAVRRALKQSINCRMLFICNPANPQGRCYSRQTLEGLAAWCTRRKMHLVVDEIYAMSTFPNGSKDTLQKSSFTSVLSIPSQQNVHCLYSMSKDFNMGGLRVGFLITRNASIKAAASGAAWFTWLTVPSDRFVTRFLEQLDLVQDYLNTYRLRLGAAYQRTTAALNRHGIPYQPANAGLFIFIDLGQWVRHFDGLGSTCQDMENVGSPELQLCRWLIGHGVFLNAGEFAGCDRAGYFRLVFTEYPEYTETAVNRIREALDKLDEKLDPHQSAGVDFKTMEPHLAYEIPDQPIKCCNCYESPPLHEAHGNSHQISPSSSDITVDDWTSIEHPSSNQATSAILDSAPDEAPSEICIFAQQLIPGRAEPVRDAAVGVSLETGLITFVGPQSQLPQSLVSVPRVSVSHLMAGLWDCHTHFIGVINVDFPDFIQTHPAMMGAAITRDLHQTLMAGFTSVRDVGSFATEVAPLVEKGIILGPNIFGAGGAIGITGGSCDARTLPSDYVYSRQGTSPQNPWPGVSALVLADGGDQCRVAVRQQIRRGARCIKVVATGGVLSTQDDPQYRQYSDAELEALISEASLQGRSVAVHAHGKAGIIAAVKAGAHTIEHGSYIDEEAAELMVKRGVTLVATRHVIEAGLKNLDKLNPPTAEKMVKIADAHYQAYRTAVRKGVKIALGTDIASSDPTSDTAHGKNGDEVGYAVKAGLTPLQAIDAGTINSAETLGALTPKKGLIQVGWDADLIALDQDPLKNIEIFGDAKNIKYVWKGGLLVKSPQGQVLWPPLRQS